MKLKQVIENVEVFRVAGSSFEKVDISNITCDSRDVTQGSLFVARRGPFKDGHCYIQEAVNRGAAAVVLEDEALAGFVPALGVPHFFVKDSGEALTRVCGTFFDHPYQRLKSVGITGTNGKTTVSYLIKSVLEASGISCGVIGTIGYKIKEVNTPFCNTTPGILEMHKIFYEMLKARHTYAAVEVSSHALDQGRLKGLNVETAVFTNLTQDHLDYHKTMDAYFEAKRKLFCQHLKPGASHVINADDPFGRRLLGIDRANTLSFGFSSEADVRGFDFQLGRQGSRMDIATPQGKLEIVSRLLGRYNLYNILAAVAFGVSESLDLAGVAEGIEKLESVPGRLDRIETQKGFSVFVDYAHTEDALKNVLESLRVILGKGRIITVFGCGGNRDQTKRSKMGAVASKLSDYCVITSDNPRHEDPLSICSMIAQGADQGRFEIEPDRFCAIKTALGMAERGDFVLIAGKGHETYQVIGNQTRPFCDKTAVCQIMEEFKTHVSC